MHAHMKVRGQLSELVLSFHRAGLGARTQVLAARPFTTEPDGWSDIQSLECETKQILISPSY